MTNLCKNRRKNKLNNDRKNRWNNNLSRQIRSVSFAGFIGICSVLAQAEEFEMTTPLSDGLYLAASSLERAYIGQSKPFMKDLDGLIHLRAQKICQALGYEGYPLTTKPPTAELLYIKPTSSNRRASNLPETPLISDAIPDEIEAFIAEDGHFILKSFEGEKPYFYSDGKEPWFSSVTQSYFTGITVGAGILTGTGSFLFPPLAVAGGVIQCISGVASGGCSYLRDILKCETGQCEVRKLSYEESLKRFEKGLPSLKISMKEHSKIAHLIFDKSMANKCSHDATSAVEMPVSKLMKCLAGIHVLENCH